MKKDEPQVLIEQEGVSRGLSVGHWLVAWNIRNLSREPLQIRAGRLPHGKFRGDEKKFRPIPRLSLGESAKIEFMVTCTESPGAVIENAFLILSVLWREAPWWVFARLRVAFDDACRPRAVTESVTTQRAGFSGI